VLALLCGKRYLGRQTMHRNQWIDVDVTWLYQQPAWLLGLLLLMILLLFLEAGFRIGLRNRPGREEVDKTLRGDVTLSAMLALLGLMLAFTYAFSLSRADLRKQAIVNEANAIETAFMRADLAAEPGRSELRQRLLEYARTRVLTGESVEDLQQLHQSIERSLEAQGKLWPATKLALQGDAPTPFEASLVQAINAVMDAHTTRLAVGFDQMPALVLFALGFIAALSLAGAAHNAGLRGRMIRWRMIAFALTLVVLIIIIVDFDQSLRGFIQVSNQSLISLVQDMEAAITD
jgi:hypothetical protein